MFVRLAASASSNRRANLRSSGSAARPICASSFLRRCSEHARRAATGLVVWSARMGIAAVAFDVDFKRRSRALFSSIVGEKYDDRPSEDLGHLMLATRTAAALLPLARSNLPPGPGIDGLQPALWRRLVVGPYL